jgi:hypothetical protein
MSADLKCPACGGLLQKGYIQAPRGIYWDTEKHKFEVFISEEIVSSWSITMPNRKAFRCQKCKLVIFNY